MWERTAVHFTLTNTDRKIQCLKWESNPSARYWLSRPVLGPLSYRDTLSRCRFQSMFVRVKWTAVLSHILIKFLLYLFVMKLSLTASTQVQFLLCSKCSKKCLFTSKVTTYPLCTVKTTGWWVRFPLEALYFSIGVCQSEMNCRSLSHID